MRPLSFADADHQQVGEQELAHTAPYLSRSYGSTNAGTGTRTTKVGLVATAYISFIYSKIPFYITVVIGAVFYIL